MKKQFLLLMIIGFLFSCNKDENNEETEIIGNWHLIQMTGNTPNSETRGDKMTWQETYYFNADGTFQKSRDRDGTLTEVSGTYNVINNTSLKLIFNSKSEIIGSCNSNTEEIMNVQSKTIFSSTWNACDGPGLKYEKIN